MTDRKNYEPDQTSDDALLKEKNKVLLPSVTTQVVSKATSYAITRHDPFFVTQLIATATQAPQTRTLRRASAEDAQTSYRSTVKKDTRRARSRTSRVA